MITKALNTRGDNDNQSTPRIVSETGMAIVFSREFCARSSSLDNHLLVESNTSRDSLR